MNLLSHFGPHHAKLRERLRPKLDQPPIDDVYAFNQAIQTFGQRVHFVIDDRDAISRRGVIDDDATIVRGAIAIDLGWRVLATRPPDVASGPLDVPGRDFQWLS